MTKLKQKRESLERKVLCIFETIQEFPELGAKGIGNYSIKRTLLDHDKNLRVSINTVKRIVDKLLDDDVIERVNPGQYGARYRLREIEDDLLDSFSRSVRCAQKLNVKGFKKPVRLREG